MTEWTNAQWLETLLPLSRNSEDTDTVVSINHEALENIRKFLLASGVDPGAVLRGEADGAKIGATLRAAEAFLVATGPCSEICDGDDSPMCEFDDCHYCALNRAASGTPIPPAPLTELRERITELEELYQRSFGCHHSWVEEATRGSRLQDELRELAKQWEESTKFELEWSVEEASAYEFARGKADSLRRCASELTAALDAMGRKD